MTTNLRLLITGRSKQDLEALAILLRKLPGMEIGTRLITNGHADPLYSVSPIPDALVHLLSPAGGEEELRALAARPAGARCATLVIGPGDKPELMRPAMQAGARDFLKQPVVPAELTAALQRIAKEKLTNASGAGARLTAIINAKGGSGASLLAGNLAHILAAHCGMRVALLDLDFQFGTQALHLDLHADKGLLEALNAVDSLDLVALQAYLAKHKSGLHLLASSPQHVGLPGEVSAKRLVQLLDLMMTGYEHVVVDLPRLVDPLMSVVMERAERILICIQQNVANLRDATRLMQIATNDLEIPAQRFTVVVNRYQPDHSVRVADIEQTLRTQSPVLIPNDFKRVSAAENLCEPVYAYAPNAPISRALVKFGVSLSGKAEARKKGVIGQLFSRISAGA